MYVECNAFICNEIQTDFLGTMLMPIEKVFVVISIGIWKWLQKY
jgi:hypothetical protein